MALSSSAMFQNARVVSRLRGRLRVWILKGQPAEMEAEMKKRCF